jgi:hypothetical protein
MKLGQPQLPLKILLRKVGVAASAFYNFLCCKKSQKARIIFETIRVVINSVNTPSLFIGVIQAIGVNS